MKLTNILVIIVLIIVCVPLNAGRYAGDFILIGIGVRSLGMGGAYTAVASDGSAIHWNPAGLSQIETTEASMMRAYLYDNLANYDYFSVVQPLPNDVCISGNWTRLTIDDIPVFLEEHLVGSTIDQRASFPDLQLSGTPDGSFTSSDDIYQFAFSKKVHSEIDFGWFFFKLPVDFHFGGNVKFIKRKLHNNLGEGTGFDIGALIKTDLSALFDIDWLGTLAAGWDFKDIGGTTITWDTDSKHEDEIFFTTRFGTAWTQPLYIYDSSIIVSMDVDYEYKQVYHYGFEYQYQDRAFLRLGAYDKNFSAGLGARYKKFIFDYAFITNTLGNTNRVGVTFKY